MVINHAPTKLVDAKLIKQVVQHAEQAMEVGEVGVVGQQVSVPHHQLKTVNQELYITKIKKY